MVPPRFFHARRFPCPILLYDTSPRQLAGTCLLKLSLADLQRADRGIKSKRETHYYMSSLFMSSLDPDEVSAKAIQNIILRHWEREKCLPLQKDRYYAEDKHMHAGKIGQRRGRS